MGHKHVNRAPNWRGFTIIELLMVVAIISIIATWALPRFSTARFRADAAGRLVRTLLQNAQRNAITRQSDIIVSFDLSTNQVRLVQDNNNNGAVDAGEKVDLRTLEEGAKFVTPNWAGVNGTVPSASVSGSSLSSITSMPSTIFRRDGSASSDVEIYVSMRDAVKEEYRAITVLAATGKTNMYKWNGITWIQMTQ